MSKREFNVDLCRIIATIFVIVLHILGQGGILGNVSTDNMVYWFAYLLEICVYCAVNCFALITGYVMVNRSIKTKNVVALWFQVSFYSLLITAVFFCISPETRNIESLVVAFFPIVGKQWWYVSSYIVMFLFIPFLNEAIEHVSQQAYRKLLIAILFGVCTLDCVIPGDPFTLNRGYSAVWLIAVYLFGAYIGKYGLKNKITAAKSLIGYAVMVTLTLISKFAIQYLSEAVLGEVKYEDAFISFTSITMLLSGIFMFLFCLNIKINAFAAKLIQFLSPVTLGVYLIHVHPLVFVYVIRDAFIPFVNTSPMVMLAYVIMTALVIFAICATIELLRIQLFKFIKIGDLCGVIDRKTHELYLNVFKE